MKHRSKKALLLVLAAVCVILALTLVACNATTIKKVKFKVTFEVDGVSYYEINTQGTEILQMPSDPTKDGFIFDGWYWDKDAWTRPFTANSLLNEPLKQDMRVYAKWKGEDEQEPQTHGTELSAKTLTVEGKKLYAKLPNATETFSFIDEISVADGATYAVHTDMSCSGATELRSKIATLKSGDNVFYILVTNGKDTELYTATIRRRPIYSVRFNVNGGTYVPTQYVEEDDFAEEPTTTCKGYTFDGWNYDFSKPIVKNITITASWNIVTYNIHYDLSDTDLLYSAVNNELNPTTYTVEDRISFENPTCIGYTFSGWDISTIAKGTTGDITVTAKPWSIVAYDITYDCDIANDSASKIVTNDNPTTYTVEDSITFVPATRSGYDFVAWDRNIVKGTYGDITVTASWEVQTYHINYVLNGGQNFPYIVDTYTVEDGEIWLEDANGDKLFCGWYEDEAVNIYCEEIRATEARNITLYALFDGTKGLKFNNKEHCVSGYSGNSNDIIIPSKYRGFTVTSIGYRAFAEHSELTSVLIPDSVTDIDDEAFIGCSGLASVTIPANVKKIGYSAFRECSGLTTVNWDAIACTIANNDSYYYKYYPIFVGCTSLITVNIGDNVTTIPNYAFKVCNELAHVNIGKSVRTIGESAFELCSGLTSVKLKNGQSRKTPKAADQCNEKRLNGQFSLLFLGYLQPNAA